MKKILELFETKIPIFEGFVQKDLPLRLFVSPLCDVNLIWYYYRQYLQSKDVDVKMFDYKIQHLNGLLDHEQFILYFDDTHDLKLVKVGNKMLSTGKDEMLSFDDIKNGNVNWVQVNNLPHCEKIYLERKHKVAEIRNWLLEEFGIDTTSFKVVKKGNELFFANDNDDLLIALINFQIEVDNMCLKQVEDCDIVPILVDFKSMPVPCLHTDDDEMRKLYVSLVRYLWPDNWFNCCTSNCLVYTFDKKFSVTENQWVDCDVGFAHDEDRIPID